MKQKTLALAGLFQAAELVRQAASHGTWSGYAATALLGSLLKLESDSVDDIYGDRERMRLGVESLLSILLGERRHLDTLQYAIAILKVERRFHRDRRMQALVGSELERIGTIEVSAPGTSAEDVQAADIADLYTRSISHLNPRIVVHGNPRHLQDERTVNWIRTLLFAGLRSAVLWRQLGGSRWQLMFGRRQILREAEELIPG